MSCCNIYTSCSFSETQVMFYTCPKQDMSHPTCLRSWNGRDWCGSNFFQFFSYDPNITGHARMCYNMVTEVTRDRMRCFAHRELNWTAMFIACKRSWLFVKGEFCKIEILQNISIAGNIFFHCKPYQLFFFFFFAAFVKRAVRCVFMWLIFLVNIEIFQFLIPAVH